MSASSNTQSQARAAFGAGLVGYLIWGFMPLAMQAMARTGAGAWEILCQRIIWGAVTAGIFVLASRQAAQVRRVLKDLKTLGWLLVSAGLIGVNWVIFIQAVDSGRVLDTSLAYYINPLVNMVIGAAFFRERLARLGWVAVGLACVGVVIQTAALGHLPWISLAIAASFSGYGIVRKRVKADAQTGLFIECLLLAAPSLAFIAWLEMNGGAAFFSGPKAALWLIASGPITAAPLALFAWAVRRMSLAALGFLQFLTPTMSFAVGVIQGEPLSPLRIASFAFIWLGAVVFVVSLILSAHKAALETPPAVEAEGVKPT